MSIAARAAQAFPVPAVWSKGECVEVGEDGMELRDYFAIHILQGLMAQDGGHGHADPCRYAYALADAMLKARDG